jgi:tRNA pseudouridine32 synthase / 23S rRNA pseudouridine746 synthase
LAALTFAFPRKKADSSCFGHTSSMQSPVDTFIAPPCHEQITILFRDEHILLINKPSKLLSLSGKNPLNFDSVHYRLVQDFPSATLVHRLDFGTSGIMLVALSKAVNANLGKQFQARSVKKAYSAILQGHVRYDEGLLEFPIAKDKENFPLQKICSIEGKPSVTHYQVVERQRDPMLSKVVFTPITGRTHQLRIHSLEMGHPIIGCDLYSTPESRAMSERLMLHATKLEFDHPVTGERMKGVCPEPF